MYFICTTLIVWNDKLSKEKVFICVLFWTFISHQCTIGTATVTLTSTLDGRQTTCPGEVVSYTCTVLRTAAISWVASPGINRVDYYPRDQIGQRVIGDFQIALISNIRHDTVLADLTITLTVTATAGRNGTVVQCLGDEPSERMSLVLNIASGQTLPPSPPQNPGYHVQHYGPHNVTVTVQWGYPEFDGGVPVDNYTISGTNIMTTTSQINETTLTLPYNAGQTIEVAATNCIGTSGIAMLTYFEADCGAPPPPVNGSLLQPDTNTTEGSVVVFQCDPGFVPEGVMTAVCGSDAQWSPNPGGVTCSPRPTPTFMQTFSWASIPTQTSTPTGPGSTTVPQMRPWLVPVVVVCVCVLVISCVVIIVIVGIVIARRRQSRVAKKLDASNRLELQSPTMDKIKDPSWSQISAGLMYADQGPHVQFTTECVALDPAGNKASSNTKKDIKMKENEVPPSRIKMAENVAYEVPLSRIKMAENVAYEVPPSRIKMAENVVYEVPLSRIKMAENVVYEVPR